MAPSEADGGPLEFNPSIFHHLEKGLNQNPHGLAVIVAYQAPEQHWDLVGSDGQPTRGEGCLAWTFSQLSQAARRMALALHDQGIRAASTVVCMLPNGIEWAVMFWATRMLTANFATLDSTALEPSRARELQSMLNSLRPDAIVVFDNAAASSADSSLATIGCSPKVKMTSERSFSLHDWISLLDFVRGYRSDHPTVWSIIEAARNDKGEDVAMVHFTSGTSAGQPKGCPRTGRSCAMWTSVSEWGAPADTNMRSMVVTVNFRIIAFVQSMHAWSNGGTVLIPFSSFDPRKFLLGITKYRASHLLFIPALLHAVVDHSSFGSTSTDSVKGIMIGGDTMAKDTYYKTCHAFPHAHVQVAHGMTEGGGLVHWPYSGPKYLDIEFFGEVCTLGKVQKGSVVKVADETNKAIKRGQIGELHFCSDVIIRHYVGHVQPEAFYVDEEGRQWFKTGDLGVLKQDDFLFILGRTKDVVKRAGLSIIPAALESSINAFTKTESTVIGVPHSELGAEPFVIVPSLGDTTEAEIKRLIVDSFGKDYEIRGVATLEQLGLKAYPLNQTGKIMKRDLETLVVRYLNR